MDKLDLEIDDGEFLVLVGPSGCGKSTAADAGRPGRGRRGAIHIGDRDVTNVPPKDRDIAMVFQNYALYPHMTVVENMAFALKIEGSPKEEIGTGGSREAASCWTWSSTSTASPRRSPEVSASASRWAARSSGARRSS